MTTSSGKDTTSFSLPTDFAKEEPYHNRIIAFTPNDRNGFGLVGTVQEIQRTEPPIQYDLRLGPTYLTPDWRDPIRTSLMFGPMINIGDVQSLFFSVQEYAGVVRDGKYEAAWEASVIMQATSDSKLKIPIKVSAMKIHEVCREPLFKELSLTVIIDDNKLLHYLSERPEEWQRIERSETMMRTSTLKSWLTRATILKKMLCPPYISYNAE